MTRPPRADPSAEPVGAPGTGPRLEGVSLNGPDLSDVRLRFTEHDFLEAGSGPTAPAPAPATQGAEAEARTGHIGAGQTAPSGAAAPAGPAQSLDQTPPQASLEAALPTPDPLSAEQFMSVLPPERFETLLRDILGQLPLIPDERTRADLSVRGRLLALNAEQYRVDYEVARVTLTRVLAETGVGVRDAWTRQQQHLLFMNEASGGVERDYVQATGQIEQARAQRFTTLTEFGVRADTPDAESLYQQLALTELAAEGVPIRPPDQKSGSKRVFNAFAVFSKFFVGLISGVSINLLFNPESRLYLTLIALSAGVMFSVLLLWLVDELGYRAKLAARTPHMGRPWGYLLGIVAVGAIYLGVEGFLNWDGILRVTQEIAANAAQQGQLTDLSSASDAPSTPTHWSLLAFTLGLVGMAIGAALIQGRERARTVLEGERLAGRVAALRLGRQYTGAARAADQVQYLEAQRDRLGPPRDVTSPDHARLNERVLTHWEQERDAQVGRLSSGVARDAESLWRSLEEYAVQVLEARYPKPRKGLLGR